MSERKDRLDWLEAFARAPRGSAAASKELLQSTAALKDPRVGARLREAYQRYVATVMAQQGGGAELLADEQLRYFQREYHNRLMEGGARYLPTSYLIAEAFFESHKDAPGFYLLPEKDYQVSFADFLDYITSAEAPTVNLELGYGFLEDHVYNITSSDELGSLLLETRGDGAYAVRAANLVRRGDELVVMLALGEQLPADRLAELSQRLLSKAHKVSVNPAKPDLGKSLLEAIPTPELIPGSNLLTTTALVRFNLRERRMEARCLLRDMGAMFHTWTDQIEAMAGELSPDHPGFRRMVEELDACDAVWEVAKTFTLLPAYLAARIAWTKNRQELTPLGKTMPTSLKLQRKLKGSRVEDRVLFRTISAIHYERPLSAPRLEGRSYAAPSFQVAVEGFWRAFREPGRMGRGPDGAEVAGRTWVRSHIRHKDKAPPSGQKIVFIKASLSAARLRLEKYRKRVEHQISPEAPPAAVDLELPAAGELPAQREAPRQGAFVYIMRCHAHTENLFKVGFTDRDPETRAKELSATTASPLPFMVLQAWAVTDGLAAERSAHQALSEVRLSENREFFQLTYEDLRARVDAAVAQWVLS